MKKKKQKKIKDTLRSPNFTTLSTQIDLAKLTNARTFILLFSHLLPLLRSFLCMNVCKAQWKKKRRGEQHTQPNSDLLGAYEIPIFSIVFLFCSFQALAQLHLTKRIYNGSEDAQMAKKTHISNASQQFWSRCLAAYVWFPIGFGYDCRPLTMKCCCSTTN